MVRYSLSVLALMLLYVAAHCAVLLFVEAPIAAEYWVREMLIVKRAQAAKIAKPKVLLLGGSSTLYGVDSDRLEQALGRPVYNFAVHASMRLEWLLGEGRKATKPGDVMVLILEPPYYDCGAQTWDNWQLRSAMAWDRGYLAAVPWTDRVHASLTGGTAAMPFEVLRARAGSPAALLPRRRAAMVPAEQVLQRYAAAEPARTFAYSPDNISPRGDMRNTDGTRYDGPPADTTLPREPCPAVGTMLRAFVTDMQRRRIRVLMDYAPYLTTAETAGWSDAEAAFAGGMRDYGIVMLSRRDELFFPRAMFFETELHLNSTGRAVRTEKLIADLKAAGI